jgi:predicted esterase
VRDPVLPISCSRRIVPALSKAGYEMAYREFDGTHVVPQEYVHEAMDLLVGRKPWPEEEAA